MNDVTHFVNAIRQSQADAGDALMSVVYAELLQIAGAKMAREQPGHTLQTSALVHEAWLRLGEQRFENRAHFFASAGEAMRRILVDHARRKEREKRGGGAEHVALDGIEIAAPCVDGEELLAVHDALDGLAAHEPRKAELVKLRYFVGLSFEDAAEVLGVSLATAKRDWAYARAWLHQAISAAD